MSASTVLLSDNEIAEQIPIYADLLKALKAERHRRAVIKSAARQKKVLEDRQKRERKLKALRSKRETKQKVREAAALAKKEEREASPAWQQRQLSREVRAQIREAMRVAGSFGLTIERKGRKLYAKRDGTDVLDSHGLSADISGLCEYLYGSDRTRSWPGHIPGCSPAELDKLRAMGALSLQ